MEWRRRVRQERPARLPGPGQCFDQTLQRVEAQLSMLAPPRGRGEGDLASRARELLRDALLQVLEANARVHRLCVQLAQLAPRPTAGCAAARRRQRAWPRQAHGGVYHSRPGARAP